MSNGFNNKWKLAETTFAEYFNGVVVEDLEQQYKDIDIRLNKSGKTVSIKDIGESSKKYGGVLFETQLLSTKTGKTSLGSFNKCDADLYAIRLWWDGHYCWYVTNTSELKEWVSKNSVKDVRTRAATERRNAAAGRFYNGSVCKMVTVRDLVNKTHCLCIPIKDLKCKTRHVEQCLQDWNFI